MVLRLSEAPVPSLRWDKGAQWGKGWLVVSNKTKPAWYLQTLNWGPANSCQMKTTA